MLELLRTKRNDRQGAMLVLIAVVLVIMLVGVVFSVDVAYMHMVRAELRTATDAAARAGTEALARTQSEQAAVQAALDIADRNVVAGDGLTLLADDIEVGSVQGNEGQRFEFVPNQFPLTSVRVTGRRQAGAGDGEVPLFFARVFDVTDFQPIETATASANVRDVALVLDVSGSMGIRAGGGTRLTALQDAVEVFLEEIEISSPTTRISLTSYASAPAKLINLTNDFDAVERTVNNFFASGATAIGNGLTIGSNSLINDPGAREFAEKTIIVMTDGNHNTGPSPAATVSTAIARDQTVHTITFSAGANQGLMRSVAQRTDGGIHIHADDAGDLSEAFREIARTLSVVLVQ